MPGNASPAPIFCSVCKPIVTARFFLIFVWLCSQYFVVFFLTEIMHPISQAYWQGHWPPCMGRPSGPGPLPGAPIAQPWQRIPQNNVFTLTGGAHHRKLAAPDAATPQVPIPTRLAHVRPLPPFAIPAPVTTCAFSLSAPMRHVHTEAAPAPIPLKRQRDDSLAALATVTATGIFALAFPP